MHDVTLVLITISTLLDRPKVIKTLDIFDCSNGQILAKLDAGTEEYYRLIERTNISLNACSKMARSVADARATAMSMRKLTTLHHVWRI